MISLVEPGGKLPLRVLFRAAWTLMLRSSGWLLLLGLTVAAALMVLTAAVLVPNDWKPSDGGMALLLGVGWLIIVFAGAAAIDLLHRRFEGGSAAFGLALKTGFKRLPLVVLMSIVILLAVLLTGFAVIIFVPVNEIASGLEWLYAAMGSETPLFDLLALVALSIPVLAVAVPCLAAFNIAAAMCLVICIVERRWPISTIGRFFELMKGHWWRGIAAFVLAGFVFLLADIALMIGVFIEEGSPGTAIEVIFISLRLVWSVLYTFWTASLIVAFYGLLRRLKAETPPTAGTAAAG